MVPKKINSDTYQAYLVRFWRRDAGKTWRVTIQFVDSQEEHHFATVAEAIAFLQAQLNR